MCGQRRVLPALPCFMCDSDCCQGLAENQIASRKWNARDLCHTVTSFLSAGDRTRNQPSRNLVITANGGAYCLSLVVRCADMPIVRIQLGWRYAFLLQHVRLLKSLTWPTAFSGRSRCFSHWQEFQKVCTALPLLCIHLPPSIHSHLGFISAVLRADRHADRVHAAVRGLPRVPAPHQGGASICLNFPHRNPC